MTLAIDLPCLQFFHADDLIFVPMMIVKVKVFLLQSRIPSIASIIVSLALSSSVIEEHKINLYGYEPKRLACTWAQFKKTEEDFEKMVGGKTAAGSG